MHTPPSHLMEKEGVWGVKNFRKVFAGVGGGGSEIFISVRGLYYWRGGVNFVGRVGGEGDVEEICTFLIFEPTIHLY